MHGFVLLLHLLGLDCPLKIVLASAAVEVLLVLGHEVLALVMLIIGAELLPRLLCCLRYLVVWHYVFVLGRRWLLAG